MDSKMSRKKKPTTDVVFAVLSQALVVLSALLPCQVAFPQEERLPLESILGPDFDPAKYPPLNSANDSYHTDWTHRADIFLLVPGESIPNQITNDRLHESRPSWMGDKLLYGAVNEWGDSPETHIFLLDTTTGHREEFFVDEWLDYSPWYSPGADRFLFYSDRKGDLALFTAAPDGSDIQALELPIETGEKETYAHVWSDDGSKIAYMQQIGPDSGYYTQYAVYYYELSTKTIKRVSQNPSNWGIFSPKQRTSTLYPYWNHDSTRLIYTSIAQIGRKSAVEVVAYDTISGDYKRTTLNSSLSFALDSAVMAIPSGLLSSDAEYIVSIRGAIQSLCFVKPTGELSAVPMTYGQDTALHARIKLAPSIGPEHQLAYVSGGRALNFNSVVQYRKHATFFRLNGRNRTMTLLSGKKVPRLGQYHGDHEWCR